MFDFDVMKRFFFISIFLLSCAAVNAQPVDLEHDISAVERVLANQLQGIVDETSYFRRDSLNTLFVRQFEAALHMPGSFGYPFDSLQHVGRLLSDDGRVRVFTWNIPQVGGTQQYFGFVQVNQGHDKVKTYRLSDNRNAQVDIFNQQLSVDQWLGALYYQIVTVKTRKLTYYVLLGYDYNNLFSSKKVIEPLSLSLSSQPIFGLPVFDVDGKQRLSRIVFEFTARASMTLRYEARQLTIVFDHLSPSEPQLAGSLQYYGPDFSYDGFKLTPKDGVWHYVRDLDMRNDTKPRPTLKELEPAEPFFLYKSNYKK